MIKSEMKCQLQHSAWILIQDLYMYVYLSEDYAHRIGKYKEFVVTLKLFER